MLTDQGGLQSSVDDIEFSLCLVVKSFHEVFLGFFPVTQLSLNQGHIVENLWQGTLIRNLSLFESLMQTTELRTMPQIVAYSVK